MKNKENMQEVLQYFQNPENKELYFDEEAIVSAYEMEEDHQSLAIKVLSIFGGILASIAFLGFLFIGGLYDSDFGLLIFGTIFIALSIFLNKKFNKIIIDTVSVSAFIMGFVLLGVGFFKMHLSENTVSIIFIAIAALSLVIVQNYLLSFISILIINGAIIVLILSNHGYDLIHIYISALAIVLTYVFLKEGKIITTNKTLAKLYNPLRIGLIFSFLPGLVILGKRGLVNISPDYSWLSSIVIILAIVYVLSKLFELLHVSKTSYKIIIYVLTILMLLPTVLSPAISGSILIILLCFLVNYKTGLAIGMLAFIYFISQYYYDLNFTLLTKSILLFSSGILFLLLFLFTFKKLTSHEKV